MAMQYLIGIGEMKISNDPSDVLIAPNLGSCLGVAVYDGKNRRGGVVHCLLPMSKADPVKAAGNPGMYVDTGFALLLDTILSSGVCRKTLSIVVVGGASMTENISMFEIGKKNIIVLRKILWKNGLLLRAEHVGESCSRTLSLHIETGKTTLKANSEIVEI